MTSRVYSYDIKCELKNNRQYKTYIFTFISEFTYNTGAEWVEKTRPYLLSGLNIHFSDAEEDGNYYIYLRKKKKLLEKGVNIIWLQ